MSIVEYTEVEEGRVKETIGTLRKMRAAGLYFQEHPEGPKKLQETLAEADTLAQTHGSYLVELILDGPNPKKLEELEAIRSEMRDKYQGLEGVKKSFSARQDPVNTALLSVIYRLGMIGSSWDDLVTKSFLTQFRVADMEFADLADNKMGILAPLSTDLLVASLIPPTLQRTYHKKELPQVRGVWADLRLKNIVLPQNRDGAPAFAGMERILVFVDNNNQGDTINAVAKAATLEYPGKVIPSINPGG